MIAASLTGVTGFKVADGVVNGNNDVSILKEVSFDNFEADTEIAELSWYYKTDALSETHQSLLDAEVDYMTDVLSGAHQPL